jgi:hypothetical protein
MAAWLRARDMPTLARRPGARACQLVSPLASTNGMIRHWRSLRTCTLTYAVR